MQNMKTAYIGLGSNLGDRAEYIEQALRMLGQTDGIKVVAVSKTIETSPLERPGQPNYLNAVVQIETSLKAAELFTITTGIENTLRRVRTEKWSPRTIDLDLLLYEDEVINTELLTIPHSQMHLRSFVLKGLCQLAQEMRHPVLKRSVRTLADRLNGRDFTINPDVPQLISVAGLIGVGKTTLTTNLTRVLSCKAVYEEYDTNPFLQQVYAGKTEMALDSELYFLVSRVRQLNPAVLQKGTITIADYAFEAELIYSKRLLDPQQLELHNQIFPHLAANVTKPALAIYMQDSPRNCLKRIHDRNRPYEQGIELDFLEKLSGDYDNLFAQWHSCPVLRISKSDFDCTKADDIAELIDQIKHYTLL
ncbi:MAG: 2-amino-4-hydroxy-6-hydroxymethyldihydropteridine diphosphokinase [Candidatus Brocadiia bacterium]|nr:MAG: 2-amino-4-hydroxy-6-hydroxymethyldihydropteridine diphosphokinase [Candidatus Brocadiia bacterium]